MKANMKNVLFNNFMIFLTSILNIALGQAQNQKQNLIIRQNIVYFKYANSSRDSISLMLDVYQSSLVKVEHNPVILFVHGGGFAAGDKEEDLYVKMASAFANHGYVAISINYTLKDEKLPYTNKILERDISEVIESLKWIKVNYSRYNMDTTRVIICGDSAGGGIVVNTSFNCTNNQHFAGCIDLWGGLPGKSGWDGPIFIDKIEKCYPPTCIIHGTKDSVVPFKTSRNLSSRLTKKGIYNELHPLKGADHFPDKIPDLYIPIMISFADKICSFN